MHWIVPLVTCFVRGRGDVAAAGRGRRPNGPPSGEATAPWFK